MSLKNKLDDAYRRGVTKERARVLWLIDEERKWLRKALEKVLLIEAQRHALQVKVKIATSLFQQLEMRIVSGAGAPPKEVPDAEDAVG